MRILSRTALATAASLLLISGLCGQEGKRGLVLISIDGLNPEYVTQAEKYGLKIPVLRAMVRDGAHAKSVRGVLPTVTYPSHTTMLTGVWPAKHGIYANVAFDPLKKNLDGWYWYSEDIRARTLWQAASEAGYTIGSVSWPVSVGAPGVQYVIPEYWRSMTGPDDLKLMRAISTPGLVAEMEKVHGPYVVDLDDAVPGDWKRTRFAESIIKSKKAQFITIHIASLDHLEHETGPGSPKGFAALEEIDKMVGVLQAAIRQVAPQSATCVVSDHGMARVERTLNLQTAFVKAGLLIPGKDWQAQAWISGGSAAILMKNPEDRETRAKVNAMLKELASDPANGIEAVLDPAGIAALGGAPNAVAWVDMKPGFALGGAVAGELVTSGPVRGTHGFSPKHPVMRAAFFLSGSGVRKGADAGDIDMRTVAPTLAKYLGLRLPDADLPSLDIF